MVSGEPQERVARCQCKALAVRFRLPYSDDMQDWEWEVADYKRFGEFLDAYQATDMSDDERFSSYLHRGC